MYGSSGLTETRLQESVRNRTGCQVAPGSMVTVTPKVSDNQSVADCMLCADAVVNGNTTDIVIDLRDASGNNTFGVGFNNSICVHLNIADEKLSEFLSENPKPSSDTYIVDSSSAIPSYRVTVMCGDDDTVMLFSNRLAGYVQTLSLNLPNGYESITGGMATYTENVETADSNAEMFSYTVNLRGMSSGSDAVTGSGLGGRSKYPIPPVEPQRGTSPYSSEGGNTGQRGTGPNEGTESDTQRGTSPYSVQEKTMDRNRGVSGTSNNGQWSSENIYNTLENYTTNRDSDIVMLRNGDTVTVIPSLHIIRTDGLLNTILYFVSQTPARLVPGYTYVDRNSYDNIPNNRSLVICKTTRYDNANVMMNALPGQTVVFTGTGEIPSFGMEIYIPRPYIDRDNGKTGSWSEKVTFSSDSFGNPLESGCAYMVSDNSYTGSDTMFCLDKVGEFDLSVVSENSDGSLYVIVPVSYNSYSSTFLGHLHTNSSSDVS